MYMYTDFALKKYSVIVPFRSQMRNAVQHIDLVIIYIANTRVRVS